MKRTFSESAEAAPLSSASASAAGGGASAPAVVMPFAGVGRSFRSQTSAETVEIAEVLDELSGRAILALPRLGGPKSDWISGHFVDSAHARQFQIVGTEEACGHSNCYCVEETHFRLVFTDPGRRLRAIARVQFDGGDVVHAETRDAAGCTFEADSLLSEAKAEPVLRRYFPRLVQELEDAGADLDVLINVGTMTCKQLLFSPLPPR